MRFTRLRYQININDSDYIDAIESIQPDLSFKITAKLDEHGGSTGRKTLGKDLRKTIEELQTFIVGLQMGTLEKIILDTGRVSYESTIGNALPVFEPNLDYATSGNQENIESISENISGFVKSREGFYGEVYMTRPLGNITQGQVWKALTLAHQKTPIKSAMELPTKSCILCQLNTGQQFCIYYGERSRICDDGGVAFDLDDGLFCSGLLFESEEALENEFSQWVARGRVGPVFSSGNPGLNHQLEDKDDMVNSMRLMC